MGDRIKIKEIRTGFSEAGKQMADRVFDSAEAFDAAVRRVDPPRQGYYKTDFVIQFEDGLEYSGRYDICENELPLLERIRTLAGIRSGRVRPHWMNERRHRQIVEQGRSNPWGVLLDRYELGGHVAERA